MTTQKVVSALGMILLNEVGRKHTSHDNSSLMSVTNALENNDSIKITACGMIMHRAFEAPIGRSLFPTPIEASDVDDADGEGASGWALVRLGTRGENICPLPLLHKDA